MRVLKQNFILKFNEQNVVKNVDINDSKEKP